MEFKFATNDLVRFKDHFEEGYDHKRLDPKRNMVVEIIECRSWNDEAYYRIGGDVGFFSENLFVELPFVKDAKIKWQNLSDDERMDVWAGDGEIGWMDRQLPEDFVESLSEEDYEKVLAHICWH